MQVAIFAVAIYTYFAISNWRDGIVGSRLNLTLGGAPPQHAARSTSYQRAVFTHV